MPDRRVCVFGAGGVGGYLAATLWRAGRNVCLVARGEHLQAIRKSGLRVSSASEMFTAEVPASEQFEALGPVDTVIITTKATALEGVAQAIGPHLTRNTSVVFAMNGVFWFYRDCFASPSPRGTNRLDPHGSLQRQIALERCFGMVVRSQNELIEPGHVLNNGGGQYFLGPALSEYHGQAQAMAELLDVPGAQVSATNTLFREMWRKLIRNIAVALVCIPAQSTAGQAFSDPDVRKLALKIMAEAATVADAHGFHDILDRERDAEIVARMNAMKPSIVQDLERRRPMEIDAQILAVQDFAHEARLSTPLIDALVPLVVLRARLAGAYEPIPSQRSANNEGASA